MSIGGQGNGLIGDYMPAALYATICPTPYQKPTNPGNNPYYPTGATQVTRESIKDIWERDRFEFVTRKNFQHAIKKQIIAEVSPEFLEGKNNWKKGFAGILGHELMEYLMVRYGNITEPIKDQAKAEFGED